jgi:hypothetical protein
VPAAQLQALSDGFGHVAADQLDEALLYNRNLWSIFVTTN